MQLENVLIGIFIVIIFDIVFATIYFVGVSPTQYSCPNGYVLINRTSHNPEYCIPGVYPTKQAK